MALKSFSIKIGSDTKDFTQGLKEADKAIKSTIKEGKALKENLKLEYSTKGFEATQKTYQHALELTNKKAQALREQLAYLEQSGGVDTDNYYDLQTKLAKTNIEAQNLQKTIENIKNIKIEQLANKFDKVGNSIVKVGKSVSIISAASAGILAGGYKLASSARQTGDELATLATQYDINAEAIQRWNYIALQTDTASESLYKGMVKVRDAVGTVIAGESNSATQAISALLGGEKLSTDGEQAFKQIISALGTIKDSSLQAYYADEIFGNNIANDLIPLIKAGSNTINELSSEFDTLGYLTNEQVAQLSTLDNALNKVTTSINNSKTQLGTALTPMLELVADLLDNKINPAIQKFTNWLNGLSSSQQKLLLNVLLLTAALGPVLLIIGKMTTGVGSLIKSCQSLSKVLTTLSSHPIILAITLIIGLLTTLYATNEEFRESVNALFGSITPLINLIANFAGGILKTIINYLGMILDLLAPIITFLAKDLTLAINIVMVALIPLAYTLEFIIKLLQTVVAVAKDVFSFKWGSIAGDVKSIWSNWESNNFAKSSLSGVDSSLKDLFGGSTSSSYDYTTYDTSSATNSVSNDNSVISNDTYNINIETTSSTTADEIVDLITKKLAIKVQARS